MDQLLRKPARLSRMPTVWLRTGYAVPEPGKPCSKYPPSIPLLPGWVHGTSRGGYGNIAAQQELLSLQRPLMMGIQEAYVRSASNIDNLSSLKTLEMVYTTFTPTIHYSNGSLYGIGLLSNFALSNPEYTFMDSGGNEPRLYMRCVAWINDRMVSVYNTHFSYESAAIQHTQFQAVLMAMNGDANPYKILFGDFNTRDFTTLSSGYTVVFTGIDNVIISKNITVSGFQTIKTTLSDHNPVFANLLIGD